MSTTPSIRYSHSHHLLTARRGMTSLDLFHGFLNQTEDKDNRDE
ncbi:hypothetical protein EDF81_1902 [Enterobacter sp. BIGb0383]|nr:MULTISPECIES: hypothetical protein [unclassified Enterobacter]ROP59118.1 hypothetical protein EDF81_1902 [Enterobacter sp. BIGb0383]ROS09416.1 hypothetical protein EC848_2938 [Enterobacter sp. BIGb0359]